MKIIVAKTEVVKWISTVQENLDAAGITQGDVADRTTF